MRIMLFESYAFFAHLRCSHQQISESKRCQNTIVFTRKKNLIWHAHRLFMRFTLRRSAMTAFEPSSMLPYHFFDQQGQWMANCTKLKLSVLSDLCRIIFLPPPVATCPCCHPKCSVMLAISSQQPPSVTITLAVALSESYCCLCPNGQHVNTLPTWHHHAIQSKRVSMIKGQDPWGNP